MNLGGSCKPHCFTGSRALLLMFGGARDVGLAVCCVRERESVCVAVYRGGYEKGFDDIGWRTGMRGQKVNIL